MRRFARLVAPCALLLGLTAAQAAAEAPKENPFVELGPLVIHGSEADTLMLGVGVFDPFDNETAPGATIEYRLGRKLWFLGLDVGGMANGEGGMMGYAGLYSDLSLGPVYLTLQMAMGGYRRGGSRDLGGVFQFRQSIDLAYRFTNGHRLGARVSHISNADLHDQNPGAEELYLTYSLPVGPIF